MRHDGWIVSKHDTHVRTGGTICGTRVVSPEGHQIDFAGSMARRDAILQAKLYIERCELVGSPIPRIGVLS